jgi:hypothetical protein
MKYNYEALVELQLTGDTITRKTKKLDRLGRKPEPVSKKQIVLYHNQKHSKVIQTYSNMSAV